MLRIHQQMELVFKPLDDFGHRAVVLDLFLAAAAGLRETFGDFRLRRGP